MVSHGVDQIMCRDIVSLSTGALGHGVVHSSQKCGLSCLDKTIVSGKKGAETIDAEVQAPGRYLPSISIATPGCGMRDLLRVCLKPELCMCWLASRVQEIPLVYISTTFEQDNRFLISASLLNCRSIFPA